MKYGQSDPYVGTYVPMHRKLQCYLPLLHGFCCCFCTLKLQTLSLSLKFDVCVIVAVVVVVSFKELFLQRKRVEK